MPNVPEATALLIGQQVQPPENQYEYDGNKRTDRIRAKRVLVMGDGGGMTYVSVPVDQLDQVRFGVGMSVCWFCRWGAWANDQGGQTSVRFVSTPEPANVAQLVHEYAMRAAGSEPDAGGGRRQA